jgi:chemotaxis protein MotB
MFEVARRRRTFDIWPGFVDALAALLLVVVFVILVFTLSHFSLSEALYGRERALERLNAQVTELARLLSLEQAETASLKTTMGELTASLRAAERDRDAASAELSTTRARLDASREELAARVATITGLETDIAMLRKLRTELEEDVARLAASLKDSQRATAAEAELSARALAQVELLNRQIAALREQLTEVSVALELANRTVAEQQVQIADLGQRLNVALATKVQELARYRSDFFGSLREALGNHPDIQIVGDRFVFQSELLFDTASAELGTGGREQVTQLVRTLKEVAPKIPPDIDWVLRIDGHTDRRRISTERFPSNWELSTARALAIVRYMIELGIEPGRLAATGFGEFHPLDPGTTERAWAKNRRIEIKLTSR